VWLADEVSGMFPFEPFSLFSSIVKGSFELLLLSDSDGSGVLYTPVYLYARRYPDHNFRYPNMNLSVWAESDAYTGLPILANAKNLGIFLCSME
jgi:hypothetical protein